MEMASPSLLGFLSSVKGGEPEGRERPPEDRHPVPLSIPRTLQLRVPVLGPHCSGKLVASAVRSHAHAQELQQGAEREQQLRYSDDVSECGRHGGIALRLNVTYCT